MSSGRCTPPGVGQEATYEGEPQAGIGGRPARSCGDRWRWHWLGPGGWGTVRPGGIARDGRCSCCSEAVAANGKRIDGAYADAIAAWPAAGAAATTDGSAACFVAAARSINPGCHRAPPGTVAAADRTTAGAVTDAAGD